MFPTALDFFVQFYLFCCPTGQITHILSPSCGIAQKLSSRFTLLRQLASSGWGAGAKVLYTAALFLVYLTTEYCAPVWCCSIHTCCIDSVLYDALCIVTGCLHPTPMNHLLILSGIQPAELYQLGTTFSLANSATLDPNHILNS